MTTLTLDITLNIHIAPQASEGDCAAIVASPTPDTVAQFLAEWASGDLGLHFGPPCLCTDAYEAYTHWCALNGLRPIPSAHFMGVLKTRFGWTVSRERWLCDETVRGPDNFFSPLAYSLNPPGNTLRTVWLGVCVGAFRKALANWDVPHA